MENPKSYEVLRNDQFGRYLVASKDLQSGELIFTDTPFAFGPKPDAALLCLGCYSACDGSCFCGKCGWPLCSPACEEAPDHAANECQVFAAAKTKFQPVQDCSSSCVQLDCVTPLRILLAKERDPERWNRELEAMETHTAARQLKPTWGADQVNIADYLVDHCKLGSRFDKDLVQRVCGILEVNAVEIPSRGGYSIRAIYPQLSIAAHNCVPNIVHTILQENNQVQVRAAVPIKKGEPLNLCYTYGLSPTLVRRVFLEQSKFFSCECKRCADPTELGTHLSTLKCQKCDNGVILSSNPLDVSAEWKCSHCEFKTSCAAVQRILAVVQAEIDEVEALEPGPAAIEQREQLLKKYKSVFHPRHALMVSLKHTLAQLYGKVEGYGIEDLPDIVLERKIEFCKEILGILDVVMPGETRMRGMMLYELHAPVMFLARSEMEQGLIDMQKLKERMAEPIRLLEEAANILGREDPSSTEGIIGHVARQSMQQLIASVESM